MDSSEREWVQRHRAFIDDALEQAGSGVNQGATYGQFAGWELTPVSEGESKTDSLAGYQILGIINRGGHGVVYEAFQKSTKRKVAIKLLREGPFASAMERARFDREVQILGQLSHPNIVTIHDSGNAAGNMFFVMDYIRGQPLDLYVAGMTGTIRTLLKLFAEICEAVQEAHLRGVIHRDLKPSNIRVDENGEPHILDFGLAKSISIDHCDGITVTGQFVGSLPWAAPEQAEGAATQIDLRTDVYSLGVILFQMLTGRFPYDVVGPINEVLTRIINDEPAKPKVLRKEIDDDVETIILKCLNKGRERRYQSAGDVARDVRHYLAGEPIVARRDSTIYVLRKQLRRHRLSVAIAFAFMITIVAGLIASISGWHQAVEQRDVAEEARAEAEAVMNFLNEMLRQPNPNAVNNGGAKTLREFADQTAQQIEVAFPSNLPVQAALHETLADTYQALGVFETAIQHIEIALGIRQSILGPDHLDVAKDLCTLSTMVGVNTIRAEQAARESLEIRQQKYGPRHIDVARSLCALGLVKYRQGQPINAEKYLQDALAQYIEFLGEKSRDTAVTMRLLAVVIREQGDCAAAENQLRKNLDVVKELFGDLHPDVASTMAELGESLACLGRNEEAEQLQRESLSIRLTVLGNENQGVANSLSNLGWLFVERGDYEEAERLYRESLDMRIKVYGSQSVGATYAMIGLARLYLKSGRPSSAETLLREAISIFSETEPTHWRMAYAECMLGASLSSQGHFDEAEKLLLNGLQQIQGVERRGPRFTLEVYECMVQLYVNWNKPAEVERYLALLTKQP